MTPTTALLLGDESLTMGCGDQWLDHGQQIAAVVTTDDAVRAWAVGKGLTVLDDIATLPDHIGVDQVEWLLSIANLKIIPDAVLGLPTKGAVNFHDGPLPKYAGLNTPAWAIWNGEAQHGVTWHLIEGGVDKGDILDQRLIDIAPDDTALSLNSKCYAAGMESFAVVMAQLGSGDLLRTAQDLSQRSYFARDDRPAMAGLLDLARPAADLARQVRALDFGGYANPLTTPKLMLGDTFVTFAGAQAEDTVSAAQPGTVLEQAADSLRIATGAGVLNVSGIKHLNGQSVMLADLVQIGDRITPPADTAALTTLASAAARAEPRWADALAGLQPAPLPMAQPGRGTPEWDRHDIATSAPIDAGTLATAALALVRMSTGEDLAGVALATNADHALLSSWVPLMAAHSAPIAEVTARLSDQIETLNSAGPFASDIILRTPALAALETPAIALNLLQDTPVETSAVTVTLGANAQPTLHIDTVRIAPASAALLVTRFEHILGRLASAMTLAEACVMPQAEATTLLDTWNATACDIIGPDTIHAGFEAQADKAPDAPALVFEDETLSYGQLDARANGLAATLQAAGVKPGSHVGLCVARGPLLLIGALAILKAGGAYVPLDPAYPPDRLAHYVSDSQASVIVTQASLRDTLPTSDAKIILAGDSETQPERVVGGAASDDLAYVIYTSGSTGTPKGVMVEHGNVANFFTGMDDVVDHERGGVWMAVTSLAFDISVLELFYTLARGFKLVLVSDEGRASVSGGPITGSGKHADFSLYYWSNDCEAGRGKYELLLEGAKFADENGFDALWTPERHFHAFGGPYPNPAVTGAAVAAITKNLQVRAGSCVAPLHHPARIAEEWAVIDNLTNGGAGMAIASGWQPEDFVLRPENTPPHNSVVMFDIIDQLRRMWRGEPVEFPNQAGDMVPIVTQPRPVSDELNVWVTTAGNPATWKKAGEVGANILTHLLGQSIDEVGEKITLYHQALRDNGHDPAERTVTVMLHTLIGEDRDEVLRIAEGPMKDYLRSAAGLIKQYAWAFPAFKKPEGVTNPFQLDLAALDTEEMEAILHFAFERYFYDAGLFGTVEDGIARVEQLKAIGVGEIACLIDYGVSNDDVMDGLVHLTKVRERSNAGAELREDDYSIAAQLIRHNVTHMQCTPSMARMLTMNDEARMALGGLRYLYLGGEALPGTLVGELRSCTRAKITNMYGPTETTIWSATQAVEGDGKGQAAVSIGAPIANTSVYVLSDADTLVPTGVAGELLIGGQGVARGYWQRDDLTADRFIANPFGDGRLYRTGDLVRWATDGRLEFLGRTDHQVKIRGQRIELGEIEARIAANPSVRECVVVARETPAGDVELAAYVIADSINAEAIRADLATHLPDVMVPRHIVKLDHFPLTPNKKIDRKALPAPQAQTPVDQVTAATPTTGAATDIARIWSRILGVSAPRGPDSFFDLGGHSLLAVQAHREIRTELDAPKLSITDIFRFPTLDALAGHVDKLRGAEPANAETATQEAGDADRSETMSRRRAMRAARGRKAG
ncbi:MAG: MupA/Atu3671 family FMN-dependent luciferase-like monooxygenase [Roseovarius sp.]